jgi:hypothetical protein
VWGAPRLAVKTGAQKKSLVRNAADEKVQRKCALKRHHVFIKPVRPPAQKPIATGSYANAANL